MPRDTGGLCECKGFQAHCEFRFYYYGALLSVSVRKDCAPCLRNLAWFLTLHTCAMLTYHSYVQVVFGNCGLTSCLKLRRRASQAQVQKQSDSRNAAHVDDWGSLPGGCCKSFAKLSHPVIRQIHPNTACLYPAKKRLF